MYGLWSYEEIIVPESKVNEIINDVSGICENGTPLENDLTQVRVILVTFVKLTKKRDNSILLIILLPFF